MIYIEIITFILLILGVGFFSSAETAYLSLSRIKLRQMQKEGNKQADLVAKLKQDMDQLLTTVLIGTNFLNSLTSALATALAISVFGKNSVEIVPFVVAFFITVFGQIIPKTAAVFHPEKFVLFTATPLKIIQIVFFPVIKLFEGLSNIVVKFSQVFMKQTGTIITEEELKTLIDIGANEGTIEKDERYMLNKLIKFNDLEVNDIMKHRSNLSMIEVNATQQEVIDEFLNSGFSTLTVFNKNRENVVGILNYKTVLYGSNEENLQEGYAGRVMEEVLFVPGTFSVLDILKKFRETGRKFAVVLTEQGETAGIITMKDILKVVFGKMTDENDINNLPAEDKIKLVSVNTFLVPGEIKIEEINSILGLKLESENMNTVGGWLLEQIGYLPNAGYIFISGKTIFIIEEIKHRCISSIKIKI